MGISTKEYCGTIVLEIDSKEYEVVSVDVTEKSTRKPVKTMNSKLRPLGSTCGTWEYDLSLECAIPLDGSEPKWKGIKNATLTLYPGCDEAGGLREIYVGCCVTEVGSKYGVDKEATRSIKMHALDKLEQ